MTDKDQASDPAVSGEDERERAIQAVVAHAAAREVLYARIPPAEGGAWRTWAAAFVLFFLAGVLLLRPPAWAHGDPDPSLSQGDLERGARAAILLQAQQVEAFRVENGRLPETIEELPAPVEGVRYVRTDNRLYQLVALRPGGLPLIYDSSRPQPGFDGVARPWLRPPP